MNPSALVGCLMVVASSIATSKPLIQTKIIAGGEVSIQRVKANDTGQSIAISGTGYEVFPQQTCGHAEITFVDANGRILFRKNAVYQTSYWYIKNPRITFDQSRIVSFSVNIPLSGTVASVFVRHRSTGGCEHAWSLQYALDWTISKIFSPGRSASNTAIKL
jgi:hypothetical protein